MHTLQLTYDATAQGPVAGWYFPTTDLDAWLGAYAGQRSGAVRAYLAPRSVSDRTAVGLIALRNDPMDARLNVPAGAIPLVCLKDKRSGSELWLPMFASPSLKVPLEDLLAHRPLDKNARLVWLPPDGAVHQRLIGLTADDEVDMSVLVRPLAPSENASRTQWHAPPQIPRLPERIVGLNISYEMMPPDPFTEERESIGGDSDDLMGMDEHGRPDGGSISSRMRRMFRQGLEKLVEAMKRGQAQAKQEPPSQPGASSKPARQPAGKPKSSTSGAGLSQSLYHKLQSMLTDQREKQLKKLLALMARDPDRALKYAVPMASQGAARGLAQPGSQLGRRNVDFSLSGLFGGGQPVDPWQLDAQLQAQLLAAYRSQADREMAAGRYRRAAYIYAHLLGEISSAAAVLEKGKFFIEAGALYRQLGRPMDQARCLRMSGQLAEAAAIYEELENFEVAAEMWAGVGDHEAARNAYGKACENALKNRDILKAVAILQSHLDDAPRAESLLWEQWPRGYQVMECTKLAFERLAQTGRFADAHQRFEELVGKTDQAAHTLLSRLCAELYKSFPDPALRSRLEDQCRISAVDRISLVPQAIVLERMQILGSLHGDDLLLQRDARRFQRKKPGNELNLAVNPDEVVPRGKLRALASAKLGEGQFQLGMMIEKQLFTLSQQDGDMVFSRYADLTSETPSKNSIHSDDHNWDITRRSIAHCQLGSDPLYVHVGYQISGPESVLLTSPSGGDDFWLVKCESVPVGDTFLGVGDDGYCWWLKPDSNVLQALHAEQLPQVVHCDRLVERILRDETYFELDASLASRQTAMVGNQPCISYQRAIIAVRNKVPYDVTALDLPIEWMVPSLPMTQPRLLVATANDLWVVHLSSGIRPERLISNENFIAAAFLPGGRIAAATQGELFLFQRSALATKLVDRKPLQTSQVVAVLSLTAETIGVLYAHGMMQRWRIM